MLLRKAAVYPENRTEEVSFMLVSSEMYAGEYSGALRDCDTFIQQFPESRYVSYIQYQKGRALFYLGEYDKAILILSDFCHQYQGNEMYPSALFWIAESFFAGYSYDDAKKLYTRIVNEFSDDPKAPAAQYRIEEINQRSREEKLLYLLKETGEEYLAAKEEYEKQLKTYNSEGIVGLNQKIIDLQKRNSELEAQAKAQKKMISDLEQENTKLTDTALNPNSEEIQKLKLKALEAQKLLDEKQQEKPK